MFRTFYVNLQEDYIVHAALYGMFPMHLCMGNTPHRRLHVQYSLPEDWHKMFKTRRKQGELN